MAILETVSALGILMTTVRNTMGYIRSLEQSQVDRDLLRLKEREILNALEDFKTTVIDDIDVQKASKLQDLISRGMASSSLKDCNDRTIDNDAYDRIERAEKHVQQSIEEIGLIMRRCKR